MPEIMCDLCLKFVYIYVCVCVDVSICFVSLNSCDPRELIQTSFSIKTLSCVFFIPALNDISLKRAKGLNNVQLIPFAEQHCGLNLTSPP